MTFNAERFDRDLRRIERINNVLGIGVPACFIGLALLYASRRHWGWVLWYVGLTAFNIALRLWMERRAARIIAERQAKMKANLERLNREWGEQ